MKIAIVISQLIKGGAERVVCNLANYLSKNHDVSIISFRSIKCEYDLDNKVNVIYVDNEKNSKVSRIIKRRNKVKKILQHENYDVILSFLPKPSYMILSLKKYINSKVIVSVRNDPKVEYKSFINKYLMKKYYKKADGFVFQTKEAQQYFSNSIQNKSTIIFNSVNEKFIKKPFEGKRKDIIVSVGRLNNQKNHELLINAFEKIHKQYSNYKLIIYGEGNKRKELENLIKQKKLDDYIFLPGVCNDIENEIYDYKLFVLSSKYEGMPNALIEAMAMGLPCISTDCPCGGPRMLIQNNKNGILIENNNIEELVNSIKKILDDKELEKSLSKNAVKIHKKINPKIVNLEWEKYIEKIFNKRS